MKTKIFFSIIAAIFLLLCASAPISALACYNQCGGSYYDGYYYNYYPYGYSGNGYYDASQNFHPYQSFYDRQRYINGQVVPVNTVQFGTGVYTIQVNGRSYIAGQNYINGQSYRDYTSINTTQYFQTGQTVQVGQNFSVNTTKLSGVNNDAFGVNNSYYDKVNYYATSEATGGNFSYGVN